MPWEEKNVLDQRADFVRKAFKSGVNFKVLCADFGISTKTGYKWMKRFWEEGSVGLEDRSRRPHSHSCQLDEVTICRLIRLKFAHLKWGPKKIQELYRRSYGSPPSLSSVKRIFTKAGLVKRTRKRKVKPGQRIVNRIESKAPNDVWTVDFKGWWLSQDKKRCEPLTVRDDFSRYVLAAVPLKRSSIERVRDVFERLFKVYGLPGVIRSDNGTPFASPNALFGLTKLSAWFIALGIRLDRIKPGCPSQNGGHERMHRDISFEVESMVKGDLDHHADSLEAWRREFNEVRPHEALGMKTPSQVYVKSNSNFMGTPDKLDYPKPFIERKVGRGGLIKLDKKSIFITDSLRGWTLGLKACSENELDVHFADLNLGNINLETYSFTPSVIAT